VIVADDYAEKTQQKQAKTSIFAEFPRFFSRKVDFDPYFTPKTRVRPRGQY
jgi:hypothetical protein